jgi:hypothetical protein
MEALAATALLRQHLPGVRIRFVNVVDLFKLVPNTEHPHGLTDSTGSSRPCSRQSAGRSGRGGWRLRSLHPVGRPCLDRHHRHYRH